MSAVEALRAQAEARLNELSGRERRQLIHEAAQFSAFANQDPESAILVDAMTRSLLKSALEMLDEQKPAVEFAMSLAKAFGEDLGMVINLCASQLEWRHKVKLEAQERELELAERFQTLTRENKEDFDTLMVQVEALIAAYDKRVGLIDAPKKLEIDRDDEGHMIGMREIPLTADGSMPALDFDKQLGELLRDFGNGNGNGAE